MSCPLLLHLALLLGPCCRTLNISHVVLHLRLPCHVERDAGSTYIQPSLPACPGENISDTCTAQIVFNAFIFLQLFNQFNARKIKVGSVTHKSLQASIPPMGAQESCYALPVSETSTYTSYIMQIDHDHKGALTTA